MDSYGQKRKFPYHSEVAGFQVKQRRPEQDPGREYNDPRVFQQPCYDYDTPTTSTDFAKWTPDEIKAFLDRRGGDYDDCQNFEQLVERAVEVEINTGPAVRPGQEADGEGGGGGSGDADGGGGGANDDLEEWERADFAQQLERQAAEAAAAAAQAGRRGTAAAAKPPPAPAAKPAAAAAGGGGGGSGGGAGDDDDEYDPLDAFMAEIDQEVAANKPSTRIRADSEALACDEEADPATEYMEVRKPKAASAATAGGGGYDSDEEVYATAKALEEGAGGGGEDDDDEAAAAAGGSRRAVEALAPLDHGSMVYAPFAKDFYEEATEIGKMTDAEVAANRRELEIRVSGFDVVRPVRSFGQCGFDSELLATIKRAGFEKPTPIQAQALPVALSGRDVLGIAKTGSGKTASFVLPMLVHIMDQPELAKGEGPIGLLLAPTRELAEQIHKETRRFAKPYGLRVAAAFGGLSKYEQFKALKGGSEVAVATPGRMIDLIRMKACGLARVTYLVFDEADRMFDMGFEPQVRSLLGQVRPDRQTLLFSATMPRKVEQLVVDALSSPVRITVGLTGTANADVVQEVEVLSDDSAKSSWLGSHLSGLVDEGDVIVFAGQRSRVDALSEQLRAAGVRVGAIHGEMDQYTRMGVLDAFKSGSLHVLVATDVAARGLDIRTIKTVLNYDAPRDLDTHIHRVGRTGRAGDKEGRAISLLTPADARFAGLLLQSLAAGGQEVPRQLADLAMRDPHFRKGNSRTKGGRGGGKGRRPQVGGAGLGFGAGGGGGGGGTSGAGTFASAPRVETGSQPGGGGGGGGARTFVQLPGFAKSTDDYEHEPSAAAGAPTPSGVAAAAAEPPLPPPPPQAAAAAAAAAASAPAPSTSRVDVVKSLHVGRFKSSFVSSGTTAGDAHAGPTIILPKGQTAKPAAPPPVPVTAVPHYLQQQQHGGGGGGWSSSRFGPPRGGGGGGGGGYGTSTSYGAADDGAKPPSTSSSSTYGMSSYRNMPPPPSLNNVPPPRSCGGSGPGRGGYGGGGYGGGAAIPPPGQQQQGAGLSASAAAAAIAAAQAIAARLAAQAPPGAPPEGGQPQYPPPPPR
ncbi:hypothetical protein PLESTB_000864700 [Pleodorina starrii]|uniref:RNA helicase n=1 Tax=Pleodorina starrii TaxID=330485 RepID=A0A9W6F2Q8_9CHLO|nr:hypothetical protein PLESTM_001429200 [Pleodorina starrii]GLC54448.1 hypothetical protein PLESTB_000864700 [Pleodorina starrii]GLC72103.1 hypothetical protein PLESTF_001204100 [Pleodorina starrii]